MSKVKITKKTVKNIVSVLLAGLLAFGAIFGLVKLFGDDTQAMKKISPTIFSVGGLNAKGEHLETDDTLYSDLFECRGLTIEQDFESHVKYQVFFYNEDNDFIGRTDEFFQKNYTLEEKYDNAKFCRVVINPMQQGDDSKTFKIKFWEKLGYADDLTIKVYEKQNFVSPNLVTSSVIYDSSLHSNDYFVAIGELGIVTFVGRSYNNSYGRFELSDDLNVLVINVTEIASFKVENKDAIIDIWFVKDGGPNSFAQGTVNDVDQLVVHEEAEYCFITYTPNQNLSVKKHILR